MASLTFKNSRCTIPSMNQRERIILPKITRRRAIALAGGAALLALTGIALRGTLSGGSPEIPTPTPSPLPRDIPSPRPLLIPSPTPREKSEQTLTESERLHAVLRVKELRAVLTSFVNDSLLPERFLEEITEANDATLARFLREHKQGDVDRETWNFQIGPHRLRVESDYVVGVAISQSRIYANLNLSQTPEFKADDLEGLKEGRLVDFTSFVFKLPPDMQWVIARPPLPASRELIRPVLRGVHVSSEGRVLQVAATTLGRAELTVTEPFHKPPLR